MYLSTRKSEENSEHYKKNHSEKGEQAEQSWDNCNTCRKYNEI